MAVRKRTAALAAGIGLAAIFAVVVVGMTIADVLKPFRSFSVTTKPEPSAGIPKACPAIRTSLFGTMTSRFPGNACKKSNKDAAEPRSSVFLCRIGKK